MTPLNHPNPSSSQTKTRFARSFLRSLARVRTRSKLVPSDVDEVRRQSTRIKTLSYACMARAVGPRRAWSRAVMFRLRKRATCHGLIRRGGGARREPGLAGKLREVVPGGERITDTCRLLEETAHYVKCLAIQVQVMKSIADHLSAAVN